MGKLKKKGESGASTNYVSRNQSLKKLQLSLAAFRRLCILKGIYPREPKNKKKTNKGSTANKTYYYKKDIQFLLHEPLVSQFRQYKIYQSKLKKAIGKRQFTLAKNLELNFKPEFRLDHVIKERFPSFVDALRDLDDALSLVFLFSTLPSLDKVDVGKVNKCQKLAAEFQAYVAFTGSLRKVFVSIKGIYYQAEIKGQEINWIVPHQFTQTVPADVDFRIMGTFLDLYISLLTFVNFKLYADSNLSYPPKMDLKKDGMGGGLSAYLLEQSSNLGVASLIDRLADRGDTLVKAKKVKSKVQIEALKKVSEKIASLESTNATTQAEQVDDDETLPSNEVGMEEELNDDDEEPTSDSDLPDVTKQHPTLKTLVEKTKSIQSFKTLFKDCFIFISRETPRTSLEFVLTSFGAKVGWEDTTGNSSPFSITDARITHHIIDRPLPVVDESTTPRPEWMTNENRDYVQPQWVYDSVNAKKILKTKRYQAGEVLPPHLSPFVVYEEGDYVPEDAERLFGVSAVAVAKGLDGEMEGLQEDDVDEDGDEEGGESSDEDDEEVESDEEMYQDELKAEAAGLTYTDYIQQKEDSTEVKAVGGTKKRKNGEDEEVAVVEKKSKKAKNLSGAEKAVKRELANEKEKKDLAKMMMTKKDRRLYDQIQFGKDKKAVEVAALTKKKEIAKKNPNKRNQTKKSK